MKQILVGCDPEVFIRDLHTQLPKSVIGILGGTKEETLFITDAGHGVLEDNVAAEFNIPPAADVHSFIRDIDVCMKHISGVAAANGAEIFNAASVCMPQQELENPMAWVFGCEPDYNAYTGKENPRPCASDPSLRSAGGHIHIGFKKFPEMEEVFHVIRAMDVFCGLPSVLMDKDVRRRELYGKAGACRWKKYGAEYRTLSNFWVFSDDLKKWAFDQTHRAYEWSLSHDTTGSIFADVQMAINTGDQAEASRLMRHFGV